MCVRLSRVRLFTTPWTVARQAPLSMVFSRQECWSDLPCPPPGHLPNPGIKPSSLALQADPLPSEPTFYYSVTITWYFSVPLPPFYMYIWITFLLNILKKFLNINQNKCSNIKKNLIAILVEVRNNWLLYRQWHPTPVFLPGKSHGRRSLVGCHLWGHTESDTTEVT